MKKDDSMVEDLKIEKDFQNIKPIASQKEFEKLIIDNENFAYSIVNKEFSRLQSNVIKRRAICDIFHLLVF